MRDRTIQLMDMIQDLPPFAIPLDVVAILSEFQYACWVGAKQAWETASKARPCLAPTATVIAQARLHPLLVVDLMYTQVRQDWHTHHSLVFTVFSYHESIGTVYHEQVRRIAYTPLMFANNVNLQSWEHELGMHIILVTLMCRLGFNWVQSLHATTPS